MPERPSARVEERREEVNPYRKHCLDFVRLAPLIDPEIECVYELLQRIIDTLEAEMQPAPDHSISLGVMIQEMAARQPEAIVKMIEPAEHPYTQTPEHPNKRSVWTPERRAAYSESTKKRLAQKRADATTASQQPADKPEAIPDEPPAATHQPREPARRIGSGNLESARALYWQHLSAGGPPSNEIEGAIMGETGVNRTQMLALRDELLKQRSAKTVAKADKAGRDWIGTPG